ALRGRLADGRGEESLVLETSEGLVDGPQSDVSTGPLQNLLADRNAVRAFADAKDREQDDLFELTEHSALLFVRQCLPYSVAQATARAGCARADQARCVGPD